MGVHSALLKIYRFLYKPPKGFAGAPDALNERRMENAKVNLYSSRALSALFACAD